MYISRRILCLDSTDRGVTLPNVWMCALLSCSSRYGLLRISMMITLMLIKVIQAVLNNNDN